MAMAQPVDTWTTDQVLTMLDQLGLSHCKGPFRDNAIFGRVLVILDETEFTEELGLTHSQATGVMMHLRALGAYAYQPPIGPTPDSGKTYPTYAAPQTYPTQAAPQTYSTRAAPQYGTAAADAAAAQAAASQAQAASAAQAAASAAAANAAAVDAANATVQATQTHMQAGNMLRDALGELQQADAILQKDKSLAGGMMAANIIAGPRGFGRERAFGIGGRRNLVTTMATVHEKHNAEAADRMVQTAVGHINQAQTLVDLPQIDMAVVQSLRGGVYMNLIGGALSQVVVRNKLRQSLESLHTMMTQVRAAIDWLDRSSAGAH